MVVHKSHRVEREIDARNHAVQMLVKAQRLIPRKTPLHIRRFVLVPQIDHWPGSRWPHRPTNRVDPSHLCHRMLRHAEVGFRRRRLRMMLRHRRVHLQLSHRPALVEDREILLQHALVLHHAVEIGKRDQHRQPPRAAMRQASR